MKMAFRTAFACALSIVLFQYFGNALLSTWAGFATFAFIQNDTQEFFLSRLGFLLGIIIVFTTLTFLGMIISHYNILLFILSVPIIIFSCAYLACLGFSYFNAGGWAMFLYIMAGSNPADTPQALQIAGVFLLCGGISILVCFLAVPSTKTQKIMLDYRRILAKLLFILHVFQHGKNWRILKLNMQLDHLLVLQEKNLAICLKKSRLPEAGQSALIELGKSLYQIGLMTKSTITFWRHLSSNYIGYPHCQADLTRLLEEMIQALIIQTKTKKLPDFFLAKNKLTHYRENLTLIRKLELTKQQPDFSAFLEYTKYFYHHIKLLELLEAASQNIATLNGATCSLP